MTAAEKIMKKKAFRKHRATGVQKEAYASQRIPHLKLFAGRTLSS